MYVSASSAASWLYDCMVNQGIIPVRIESMGRLCVSVFCGVVILVAACGGSAGSQPAATSVPSSPERIEPTTAPTVVTTAPTLPAATQPAAPAPTEAPAAMTQAPVVQAPAVQPVVATARPATPAPPLPTATAEAPSRPPPVTVAMVLNLADRSFTPHQVHGNAGDTVALTFMGGTEQHTFTVSSLGIDVTIAAGETKQFSFVMPVDGEVPFFCRLHGTASSGMRGLLIFH